MIREIEAGKVNTNWVTKITINGTINPMNTRRCMMPGYRSCKILRWAIPSFKSDFNLTHILSDRLSSLPMRHNRKRLFMPHEKTTSVMKIKNMSNALIILPGLTRCQHHIVAIKAFLVLGRPFKFPEMTLETFRHRGAIGTAFHVFVPGCPVTIHAI